ncbi:MAG TPA: hypothetical protein VGL69_24430 [Solirubrobacteraceae bacterium]|jgi:hypothetical protein
MPGHTPRYHVELKSFPHVARAFNLDRAKLDTRFLAPFAAGDPIEYDDRRWPADKTKLTVFEGEELGSADRGLGRGWGEVTRHGRDVTAEVLAEIHRGADARLEGEALQLAIAEVASGDGIGLPDAIALAAAAQPGWRASEQLSLAEQAVWEMLHRGRLEMIGPDGAPVAAEGWQAVVLSWAQWAAGAEDPVRLRTIVTPAGSAGEL